MADLDLDHHHAQGTQACILSSVLAPGEASAEWRGEAAGAVSAAAAASAAASYSDPVELHDAAQRALLQARQLAGVMASQLERTLAAMRDDPELAQCGDTGVLRELVRARLAAFRDLAQKQGRMEEAAASHVVALAKWVGSTAGTSQEQQQQQQEAADAAAAAELQRLAFENKRLGIKCDALERQVQLLSSSLAAPTSAAAATAGSTDQQRQPGSEAPEPELQPQDDEEMRRLRRVIEEQAELLQGLRTTLRDVCMRRDPVTQERDALRADLERLNRAHSSLLEEKAGLERLCTAVQGQLRRTANRCQDLEAYVRFIEDSKQQQQQQQQEEQEEEEEECGDQGAEAIDPSPSSASSASGSSTATTTSTTSVTPASSVASPRRPPMVHDPGFDRDDASAVSPVSSAESTTADTRQSSGGGLLQWLLSFFLVFEDYGDEEAAGAMVV